jgi:hypothetical protein
VKRLVAEGADPNYLHDSIYASPVRFAANGGHVAVVDFLLNAGGKLTKRDLTVPYLAEKAKARWVRSTMKHRAPRPRRG